MAVMIPESFELREGDGELFDREAGSQFVDLDCYRPYLADSADQVPILADRFSTSSDRFVYQHVFFRETLYHQTFLPKPERDRRYRALRELSYSQVTMRKHLENQLHQDKEGDVRYPPEKTVDDTLRDYYDLDVIAACILGIEEVKNPRPVSEWQMRQPVNPELSSLSDEDRVGAYEAKLQELLTANEKPRVIPGKIATSALMRLAILLKDARLTKVAMDRLPADGYYFPLRVPKLGTIRTIASSVLKDAVNIRDLETSRQLHQALQTGVDEVELQAA